MLYRWMGKGYSLRGTRQVKAGPVLGPREKPMHGRGYTPTTISAWLLLPTTPR